MLFTPYELQGKHAVFIPHVCLVYHFIFSVEIGVFFNKVVLVRSVVVFTINCV